MNIETVKEILSRYYEHHDSKYVFGGRKGKSDYYYNTNEWDWYMEYANSLDPDIFSRPGAPRSIFMNFQDESNAKKKKLEMSQFVAVRRRVSTKDYLEYVTVEVYPIMGLELRSVYGRPGMRVRLTGKPLLSIHIREDGEIYWSNGNTGYNFFRITSFINRLLELNEQFRKVFVDILMTLGEDRKILKDIARTIDSDHYYADPITLHDACRYRTPDELFRGEFEHALPINYNRRNMNYSWCVTKLAELIEPADRGLLLGIPRDKLMEWTREDRWIFAYGPDKSRIAKFIGQYYRERLIDGEIVPRDLFARVEMYAEDYARMCVDNGEYISLRKRGLGGLREAHDAAADGRIMRSIQDLELPLLAENSRFMELQGMLPESFTMIDSTQALFDEGQRQHNCVFSYREMVRRDEIAIFHWSIEGREYTIEFGKTNGRFEVRQMLQKNNMPADSGDRARLDDYLRRGNEALCG